MARTIFVLDFGIVRRALVDILDHQHDRRPGRNLLAGLFVRENARHDFDGVRFLPLRRKARLPRPPAVELALDVVNGERNPRRATVDHAADPRPMAFAEAGKPEEMTESIERHGVLRLRGLVARAFVAVK